MTQICLVRTYSTFAKKLKSYDKAKIKAKICGLEASFPGPIVIFLLRERNIMDMQNAWGKNSHSYVKP